MTITSWRTIAVSDNHHHIRSRVDDCSTPPQHFKKQIAVFALAGSLVLAGCGGGGGGGSSSSASSRHTPTFSGSDGPAGLVTATASGRTAFSAVSVNAPKPGSVTQTNRGDATGITTDVIEVEITGEGASRIYTITRTDDDDPDTAEEISSTDSEVVARYDASGQGDDTLSEIGLKKTLASGDTVQVVLFHVPTTGTHYLAAGLWALVPDAGSSNPIEFGAFVDGSDIFASSEVLALTGTAEYEGRAVAMYTDSQGDITPLGGAVLLEANFDTDMIGGKISDIIDVRNGESLTSGSDLMLMPAMISSSLLGGFFTGDTEIIFDFDDDGTPDTFSGKWGGQFHGTPIAGSTGDDAHPKDVAGTFAGAAGSSGTSFVGVFGANR